jgi:hypothetical protein
MSEQSLSDHHGDDQRCQPDFASSQLVCLIDDNINCNTIPFVLESLRTRVGDTILFHNLDQCEKFLEQKRSTVTFLVISDQFEESFIPRLHHFEHIWSIHICHSKCERNKPRAENRITSKRN